MKPRNYLLFNGVLVHLGLLCSSEAHFKSGFVFTKYLVFKILKLVYEGGRAGVVIGHD